MSDAVTQIIIDSHREIVRSATRSEKHLTAAWLSLSSKYQLPEWSAAYVADPDRYRRQFRDAVTRALTEYEDEVVSQGQQTYVDAATQHRSWLRTLEVFFGAMALTSWAISSEELLGELKLYARAYVPAFLATLPQRPTRTIIASWLGQPAVQNTTALRTLLMQNLRNQTRRAYRHIPGIRGYKRLAAKSPRTCAACLALDGKVYQLDVLMEEHPNGRCQLAPVTDAYEPQWESGREWFEKQSETVQRAILGPTRLQLWKSGNLTWDEIPVIHYAEGHPPSVGVVRVRDVRDRIFK